MRRPRSGTRRAGGLSKVKHFPNGSGEQLVDRVPADAEEPTLCSAVRPSEQRVSEVITPYAESVLMPGRPVPDTVPCTDAPCSTSSASMRWERSAFPFRMYVHATNESGCCAAMGARSCRRLLSGDRAPCAFALRHCGVARWLVRSDWQMASTILRVRSPLDPSGRAHCPVRAVVRNASSTAASRSVVPGSQRVLRLPCFVPAQQGREGVKVGGALLAYAGQGHLSDRDLPRFQNSTSM